MEVTTMKKTSDINGTSLQGYITIAVNELVEKFGVAHQIFGDKTTMEWAFRIGGVVFTIYDYKCGSTPPDAYRWHIGGHNRVAVETVAKLFPLHKVEAF
jgi:hypothetical protein